MSKYMKRAPFAIFNEHQFPTRLKCRLVSFSHLQVFTQLLVSCCYFEGTYNLFITLILVHIFDIHFFTTYLSSILISM